MDSNAPLPPPTPQDVYDRRTATLLGVSWTWSILSTIAIVARFWVRSKYIRKIWWDDWAMLISFIFALGITVIWTYYCSVKGLYHIWELTPDELSEALLMNWVGQTFSVAAAAATKTAVALLIARIQAPKYWRTMVLWVISVASIVAGIIAIFLVWFQCTPLNHLWHPELHPTCWPPTILINNTIWVSAIWAAADLILAMVPAQMIWQLQMPLKRKLILSSMLGCGVFAFICAIIKIYYLKDNGNGVDLTWATLNLYIWHTNEVNVVIIAGCIPTLRPLFVVLLKKPGYEEYVRHSQKHIITEETQVIVELSHRDDAKGSVNESLSSSNQWQNNVTSNNRERNGTANYSYEAWAGKKNNGHV